jgi:hypothetical protein
MHSIELFLRQCVYSCGIFISESSGIFWDGRNWAQLVPLDKLEEFRPKYKKVFRPQTGNAAIGLLTYNENKHPQFPVVRPDGIILVDDLMAPLVSALIRCGFETLFSCQGGNDEVAYIMFAKEEHASHFAREIVNRVSSDTVFDVARWNKAVYFSPGLIPYLTHRYATCEALRRIGSVA